MAKWMCKGETHTNEDYPGWEIEEIHPSQEMRFYQVRRGGQDAVLFYTLENATTYIDNVGKIKAALGWP